MCILLSDYTNTVVIKLTNQRAQIAGSMNNFKKEPRCERRKLVLEAGHVCWMMDAACEK